MSIAIEPYADKLIRRDFPEDHSSSGRSPTVTRWGELPPNRYLAVKSILEFVSATVLLVLTSPVILLAVMLVKLTSRGPGIYSQVRLGLRGKTYRIYKIRTMVHECEKRSGARWSSDDDPRVTWLGRLLRRTHLDEL